MKITHIYKTFFPDSFGGCEQVIKNLAKGTASYGYQHTLLTVSKQNSTIDTGYLQVNRFKKTIEAASCPMSLQLWRGFDRHIDDADVLHYHFPWPFADLLSMSSRLKKPYIVTYHSDIVRQNRLKILYKPLMNKFLSKAQWILPSSENYLNSSIDLLPYRNKCKVIPLGIDESEYAEPKAELIAKWQQQIGQDFLLFIGVFRYYKGLHHLIDALQNIDLPVVLAGSGPEENKLKMQVKHYNLKNVKFVGPVDDENKKALLKLCRAVLLPSHLRSEAFGISLLEGMAYAKPLITAEIGTGTTFVNQHNLTGFVIEPGNSHALKEAMQTLYNQKDLANALGLNAKTRFLNLFTAKKMAQNYQTIYQSFQG